eukprot:SAG11_NODE_1780_length_4264_cov_3.335654_2_plen_69_part_00
MLLAYVISRYVWARRQRRWHVGRKLHVGLQYFCGRRRLPQSVLDDFAQGMITRNSSIWPVRLDIRNSE